jgi:hypothetical protein
MSETTAVAPILKDALSGLAAAIDTFVPAALREDVDPAKLRTWLTDLYDAEIRNQRGGRPVSAQAIDPFSARRHADVRRRWLNLRHEHQTAFSRLLVDTFTVDELEILDAAGCLTDQDRLALRAHEGDTG